MPVHANGGGRGAEGVGAVESIFALLDVIGNRGPQSTPIPPFQVRGCVPVFEADKSLQLRAKASPKSSNGTASAGSHQGANFATKTS